MWRSNFKMTMLLLLVITIIGVACGENDSGRSDGVVRVVRRRHLDEATKAGHESNEIDDDHHARADMSLTQAEQFKSTAAACGGAECGEMSQTERAAPAAVLDGDDSQLIASSAVHPSTADEQTSESQYYYEYVGPTKIGSGEAKRASSRGRSLVPTEPDTAAQQSQQGRQQQQTDVAAVTDRQQIRKAGNSDMEDILDGFVKLLNGQPGQAGYRQPIKTRINNRGPPRIADASVVLEPPAFVPMPQHQHQHQPQQQHPHQQQLPAQNKPKDPPPYPFDVPQPVRPLPPQPPNLVKPFLTGVPLPEQLVPTDSSGDDDDELGPPSLQYEDDVSHLPTASRRPVQHVQTVKPQQEYDLFADGHPHGAGGHGPSTAFRPIENVTEKFTVDAASSLSPPAASDRPAAVTVAERPTTTDKPWSAIDINATRVIGLQVSKIVDHLTSPVVPASPIGVTDHTAAAATAAAPTTTTTTTTTTTSSTSSSSTAAESTSTTTAARPETTLAGEHVTGVGSAVVVLEPSTSEEPHRDDTHKPTDNKLPSKPTPPVKKAPQQSEGFPYYSRPGIVLDDPEFKPHIGGQRRPIQVQVPSKGDVFDIMVSAIQGPGDKPALLSPDEISPSGVGKGEVSVITSAEPNQQFVSIDGKRTYINLFGSAEPTAVAPQSIKPTSAASGSFSVSQVLQPHGASNPQGSAPPSPPSGGKPSAPAWKRPTHPPVRIDTCIVGDDTTCDAAQHERCRTELGVSSCLCRPGYSRRKHRDPCHRIVSIVFSLRVDRLYDNKITWTEKYKDSETQEYQQLEHEAVRAIDSAFSMTPFSDTFVGVKINNVYMSKTTPGMPVMVNATVQLTENAEHLRSTVKQDVQKQLTGALQRRNNNVGTSGLWVDSPAGAISQLHDLDECNSPELNDCHPLGKCTNVFGTFQCACPDGYRDPWIGNAQRSGRTCETCDPGQCNLRGECFFQAGQPVCKCSGSFYGSQCEIDGEVLSVAVGSSIAAISIIVLTLVCLCAWSRRWNKEQKVGSPVFGYMPTGGSTVKTPVIGGPPYQVSIEDRMRWAQIADAMAHANHYAPEPVNGTMRSNMFGYAGAPMPLPRLRPPGTSTISHAFRTPESSTSEEEDRTDLLGRSFQTSSRPKSRSSLANQSGIYYDVDYEQQQGEMTFSPGCIPLSTYTIGSRSNYYR
ncbi:protein piccolo [Rhopalosiphum padi]|uniref:protein piccolo n=1 Tax=Rhopalosiphum padi TaxID=40932 RepID=UPI00298D7A92|nr:protein piccolo [Rhopalosiphum padi]